MNDRATADDSVEPGEPARAGWLAKGRHEQWSARPIHALFYFTRAIANESLRGDAQFHMGEVLWQLGRQDQAKTTWREATKSAPTHLASWLAYTEACLNTGDAEGAKSAAASVLARWPDDGRAQAFQLLANAALGDPDVDWTSIAEKVRENPGLVLAPARAKLMADALDRMPDARGLEAFFEVLASNPGNVPIELLACLVDRAAGATASATVAASLDGALDEALRKSATTDDVESLRRLARAARALDRGDAVRAFSSAYARASLAKHSPAVELAWPRRTAGSPLRVVVVAGPGIRPDVLAALRALDDAAHEILLIALTTSADARPFVASLPFNAPTVIAVGATLSAAAARAVAVRDPDLIIDAVGLDAPLGPWLARRPGRAIWTLADLEPPLVDRRVEPTEAALADALAALPRATEASLAASAIEARWAMGLRAHREGDVAAARAAYSDVLDDQPEFAPARHFRARLEWDAGETDAAQRDLTAALARAPAYADARVDASRLSLELESPAHAVALAEQGLAIDPAHLGLLRALGHARLRFGDGAGAAEAFRRAALLQPLDPETQYNMGVAMQLAGDSDEAAQSYRHALAFDPSFVDAAFNLAVLHQQRGQAKNAIRSYQRVVARDAKRDQAWKNLGEILREEGRLDEWVANFQRFEAACPDSLLLAVQALEVCQFQGDFARLDRYLDGLRLEKFQASSETALVDALEELLYLLLFFDIEPSVIHRFARTYDQATRRVYGVARGHGGARRPGKLRIGYLSADLRDHVMGRMMWEAVRRHDRERFEISFYSLSGERDDWTRRYEEVAATFRDVSGLQERAAARLIEGDDLDLLVDLQTHTKGAKPGILALKPARVAITHVASAGTLGLSAIDFKLTDAYADIPESQADQIEPMLAMGGCVYPFRAPDVANVPAYARREAGIPDDAFVIGAFVTPMKLSRRCLTLWKEIADAVPHARFAFSPMRLEHRGAYEKLMAAAGIAAGRLHFLPQGGTEERNLARYRVVDVVLDPMPFGNVNGTIEPLAMGIPVVTLMGKRHGERTSYSILANLGVTSTVAQTGREYVELAVRLAGDRAFMQATRDAIVARLPGSALVDHDQYTRNLEAAYVAAIGAKAPEALESAGVPLPTRQ